MLRYEMQAGCSFGTMNMHQAAELPLHGFGCDTPSPCCYSSFLDAAGEEGLPSSSLRRYWYRVAVAAATSSGDTYSSGEWLMPSLQKVGLAAKHKCSKNRMMNAEVTA